MPTLCYTPGVQVIIESTKAMDPVTKRRATEARPVLIDVSADLVEGTMVRRSDAPSTFDFSLQNQRRKYDNLFSPNDRMYVMMKRVTWMRVYTGYVNSAPFFSAWPRVIPVTSTCSLKRLQYFYWDSTLGTSRQLIVEHMFGGAQKYAPDGGIKNAAKALLESVVGWPAEKVHIAQVPRDWLNFAIEIAKEVVDDANAANAEVQKIAQALGIGPSVAGATDAASAFGQGPPPNTNPDGSVIKGTGALPATSGRATFFTGVLNGQRDTGAVGKFALTGESGLTAPFVPGTNFYCAMRWPYANPDGRGGDPAQGLTKADMQKAKNWWANKRIVVSNPLTQKAVVVRAVDYGPYSHNKDAAVIDLSPTALMALLGTDRQHDTSIDNVNIAFAPQTMPLGPISVQALGAVGSNDSGNFNGQLSGQVGPQGTGVATAYDFVRKGVELLATYPHIPYSQQGSRDVHVDVPDALDCSEFVYWCYGHATGRYSTGSTRTLKSLCLQNANGSAQISVATALRTRGALLFKDPEIHGGHGHVEISLGDGATSIGYFGVGKGGGYNRGAARNGWDYGLLLPYINYTGAGLTGETPQGVAPSRSGYDPNSNDPRRSGDYRPAPGQLQAEAVARTKGDFSTSASQFTDVDVNSGSPIDTIFNNTTWQPIQDQGANMLSETLNGVRALLNDEPIFPYIKALMNSSLRSFCSAPNGDFMAWFPDYYGLWGTAAVMNIEPIELVDFTVMWSDDYFVTHQFVTQAYQSNFDTGTGDVTAAISSPQVTTVGIASIDIKAIMRALFGLEFTDDMYDEFVNTVYKRFGPRPDYQPLNGIFGPKGEFFMALFLFMRQWAYQYNANVDLTFMPEVYPGMLLRIAEYNFQAYVVAVTHSFRFGDGGGFTTQVNIASPARLGPGRDLMAGLPLAGNFKQAIRTADPYSDPAIRGGKGNVDNLADTR